jgi:ferrous iron transport protein B
MTAVAATRTIRAALAGNPNVGKSSLFNALTGLHQTIGNYPGVTIDRTEGRRTLDSGHVLQVVDLPGVASLSGHSPDEKIAVDVLHGRVAGSAPPDVVVAILDATNPRRGLLLLSQILELSAPVVVCLNMVDEAQRAGNAVDARALSEALGGVPVVETVASRHVGTDRLVDAIVSAAATERTPRARRADAEGGQAADLEARHRWALAVMERLALRLPVTPRHRSDRIDGVLLHPLFGSLIFLVLMGTVFQAVFSWAEPLMGGIEAGVAALQDWVRATLPEGAVNDLLVDGVLAGVGGVLVFVPQIVLLFLFLGILEDTGYMTRAAFIVDRPLRAVGLSGRAFIPLLSSFACAVPGIMATRTIGSRAERLLTIYVAPLMTCSARLPIYALVIAAFVPDAPFLGPLRAQGAVMLLLYAGGIVVASLAAWVIGRIIMRGKRETPILEMPPYRRPNFPVLATKLWHRVSAFLKRAGTVIFAVSVVLWLLAYYPRADSVLGRTEAEQASAQLEQSFAGTIGKAIEPAIAPLGFDWRVGIGILSSYLAREVFVATMGVVYAVDGADDDEDGGSRLRDAFKNARHDRTDRPVFDWPAIVALLVFYVIAPQCASTLAVVRREAGSWGHAAFVFVYLTVLAYAAALLAHRLTAAFTG